MRAPAPSVDQRLFPRKTGLELLFGFIVLLVVATACQQSGLSETAQQDQTTQAVDESQSEPSPTPFPACCLTLVRVTWNSEGELPVPEEWLFDAATTCGTIAISNVETEGDPSGSAEITASSRDAGGCTITITWQEVAGWTTDARPSRSIVGFANNSEFDIVSFDLTPES